MQFLEGNPKRLKFWLKVLVTPQGLIALVLLGAAVSLYFRGAKPRIHSQPVLGLIQTPSLPIETYTIELVNFDENQLERPVFRTVSAHNNSTELLKAVVWALQQELSIWPEGLNLITVYSLDNGEVVLDFELQGNTVLPSLNDEWRILRSLKASLERNSFPNSRILINHKETEVFLRYIRLDMP